MFWLATRASCPLGFFRVGPSRKSYLFGHIINLLLTELVRSRLLDTALFSFAFLSSTSYRSVKKKRTLAETQERAWPISRHLDVTLGQKRIYVEQISRFFHHVARSLTSALNFPGLRVFVVVVFLLRSFL